MSENGIDSKNISHRIRSKSVLGGLHHDYRLETDAS